jgi:hypothetical protein
VIFGFLRGRPLPRFTSKVIGLLASSLSTGRFVGYSGLVASFTLIPSICVIGVRYSLTEVARKVILL